MLPEILSILQLSSISIFLWIYIPLLISSNEDTNTNDQGHFYNDILSSVFILNLECYILATCKKMYQDEHIRKNPSDLFLSSNYTLNQFHLHYFINVAVNIAVIIGNLHLNKDNQDGDNSDKDDSNDGDNDDLSAFGSIVYLRYSLIAFAAAYFHYSLHCCIMRYTQFMPQNSPLSAIIQFIHHTTAYITFISYLLMNQSSRKDSIIEKLLFFMIFCKFFEILKMHMVNHLGRICYSIIVLLEIKRRIDRNLMEIKLFTKIKEDKIAERRRNIEKNDSNIEKDKVNSHGNIDNQNSDQQDQNNRSSNNPELNGISNYRLSRSQTQIYGLLLLCLLTLCILVYSIIKVYKFWKQLGQDNVSIDTLVDRSRVINSSNVYFVNDQNNQSQEIQPPQRLNTSDGLSSMELQKLKESNNERLRISIEPAEKTNRITETTSATCSICYVELNIQECIYQLPCNHMFHQDCLDVWLKRKNTCPNCRQHVVQRDKRMMIRTLEDEDDIDRDRGVNRNDDDDNYIQGFNEIYGNNNRDMLMEEQFNQELQWQQILEQISHQEELQRQQQQQQQQQQQEYSQNRLVGEQQGQQFQQDHTQHYNELDLHRDIETYQDHFAFNNETNRIKEQGDQQIGTSNEFISSLIHLEPEKMDNQGNQDENHDKILQQYDNNSNSMPTTQDCLKSTPYIAEPS